MGKVIDYKEAKRKLKIKKIKSKVSKKINFRPAVLYSIIFILIVSFVFFSGKDKFYKGSKMVEQDVDYVDMVSYARFKH